MKRFFKFLLVKLPLALIIISVLTVLALKWVPVWVTPIMVSRSIEFRSGFPYSEGMVPPRGYLAGTHESRHHQRRQPFL